MLEKRVRTSVIVANHGRDITRLKASLPKGVEFIEVNKGLERSIQRNMAIKQAKGDIILWLDSDQSLSPGVVKECEELLNIGYTAVFIPEVIVATSLFGRIRAFERTFYTGTAVDVPKAVLRRVCPLFDETLNGPEDALWGSKIPGFKGITENVLYHWDDCGFWDYFKKKSYYAKSMKRYAELNPNDKCLNLKYRCWTVFVEHGKWKELIKHPILTLGIVFLLAVRGYIYAFKR